MIKLNYEINPKYLEQWNNNKIFVNINNQKQYNILKEFRYIVTIDLNYNDNYQYYCYKGFSEIYSEEGTLKKYKLDCCLDFYDFFIIYKDIDYIINEVNDLYKKIIIKYEL